MIEETVAQKMERITKEDQDQIPRKSWKSDGITMAELEERTKRRMLVLGLIQEKTHVLLYGDSGTGKTTITFYLLKAMLDENPDLEVVYFLLDGADQIALNARNFIQSERFNIVMNKTAAEILNDLALEVKNKADLQGMVYVFDTYKKFQNDVNNKKLNTQHLDAMRKLTSQGATCISIGHTNKDSGTFSGNAELEQDTDGVVRFNRLVDVADKEQMTVSLTEGARIRYRFQECSFRMPTNNPHPAKVEPTEFLDTQQWRDEKEDMRDIESTKNVIRDAGEKGIVQAALIDKLSKEEMIGRNRAGDLLKKYISRHWQRQKRTVSLGAKSYIYTNIGA